MKRTRLHIAIVLGMLLITNEAPLRSDSHPRIWLTPTVLSALRAKAGSGNPDWLGVKANADQLLMRRMPRFTVTAATNSDPVRFTIAEPVPWSGTTAVFIGGATGAWAAVNATGGRPSAIAATRVGTNTFTIPINSTGFGSFMGQRLALFFSEGGHSAYGYEGLDWQSMLEVLGIAYQVTGNPAYASKGIELIDYIASLGVAGMLAPVAIDSGFPSRSAIYGVAIGYDWLRDRLTPNEKSAVVQALNFWFDWFKRAAFENHGPAYGNYFGGHVLGFGLAGFATEADNPRGSEIVAYVRGLFQTHVEPAFATGGFAGGYPVEGYSYGANHFQRLFYYMLAVRTATGEDIISRSDYARKIARNLIYNLKPNNWQVSDEADFAGDYTGVLSPSLPVVLSSLLAGTLEGKWMQHLCQNLAAAPHGGQAVDSFVQFLFYDRERPAADYRLTEPTWLHSPGDEHLYRRSSWQPDAVWTSIAGGTTSWANHQMRSAGHVAIQRGNDYLLVNSGQWKGSSGDFGTPRAFDLRSWRANTLFVDDFGDYLFTDADYAGGQGYWSKSHVLAREGGIDFGYLKTDLTSAYSVGDRKPWDARSVRYFYRNYLSLGNGVVVLFDRTQFLKANYVKKLYFHVNPAGGLPAIAGNTASIRTGNSVLFIRTLLPGAPVIAAAADPVSATDRRTSTYRLEVSDSIANTRFDALNVLVAAPSSMTSMPPTVRLRSTDGAMVGAMVTDGSVERVALFSADGAPQSSVSYTANYASGETGVHVLTDLVPNTRYSIAVDGVTIRTVAASSQGVLTFRSSGGGLFTVRNQDAPKPSTWPPQPTGKIGGNPSSEGTRFVAMVAPLSGETFIAPSKLRLVAVGRDPNIFTNYPTDGVGGNAAAVQFFVDYTMVLEVPGSEAEFWVFKGFVGNVAAGRRRVWARAIYTNPTLVLDSEPVLITVNSPPAYVSTIDLSADLTISGNYQLIGSPTGRVRINGNGHRIVSAVGGAGAITFQDVDFFDLGDRTSTDAPGIDLTVARDLSVEGCTFDGSNTVRLTANDPAKATVRSNVFRSNMRQPLGQYPDGQGGIRNGSFPALILSGTSTRMKVFQGNNIGAGSVVFERTQKWLVGGDTTTDSNVLIGPRVGMFADRSTSLQIRRNYSHHIYFGGWSQASNFELGGASSITAEHNVIVGSSWPVRGVGGEFRYNLVLGAGHQWLWVDHDNAYVHHNVFVGGDNDVGGIYVLYAAKNSRIENNTFDGLNGGDMATAVNVSDGAVSLTSNLFFRVPKVPITLGVGAVTADYNLSWACGSPMYSDGRAPLHDIKNDPRLTAPATGVADFDETRLWARTQTVADVLAQYRAKYSPELDSPALRAGDPAGGAEHQS